MISSGSRDFDLFGALIEAPDLLELVVQQCNGKKNNLRLACSRLRAAVDACATGMAWEHSTANLSTFLAEFRGTNGARNMAVLARCPRLQTVNFNGHHVADVSPLASCLGLRSVVNFCAGGDLAPFAALPHLEHLECCNSADLYDISAITACSALKYLDCSQTGVSQLPPPPVRLETLICHHTRLSDISALVAYTMLKHLDCSGCDIKILPPLPAGLETLNLRGTQCADLSPLATCIELRSLNCSNTPVLDLAPLAACVELRSLDCRDGFIQQLMPLLACKRLEVLECNDFDGVDDQTHQLLQAHPGLSVAIGYDDDEEEEEEEEDEEDGDGDWDALEYEMEGPGWEDEDGDGDEGGTDDSEGFTE